MMRPNFVSLIDVGDEASFGSTKPLAWLESCNPIPLLNGSDLGCSYIDQHTSKGVVGLSNA